MNKHPSERRTPSITGTIGHIDRGRLGIRSAAIAATISMAIGKSEEEKAKHTPLSRKETVNKMIEEGLQAHEYDAEQREAATTTAKRLMMFGYEMGVNHTLTIIDENIDSITKEQDHLMRKKSTEFTRKEINKLRDLKFVFTTLRARIDSRRSGE